MGKYRLVALCGKAGSGKDTILHILSQNYSNTWEIVSCTTRPKRQGEQEGVNYYYLDNETFAEKVRNGDMLEATVFNDWCYGTDKCVLNQEKWNIGVFNPQGIEILSENPELDLHVFYIYAPAKLRLMRQLTREDDPDVNEIIRRYSADENDFKHIDYRFQFTRLNNIVQGDQDLCAQMIARMLHFEDQKN